MRIWVWGECRSVRNPLWVCTVKWIQEIDSGTGFSEIEFAFAVTGGNREVESLPGGYGIHPTEGGNLKDIAC